ncbi:hypothetical protein HID58_016943 [Brassica napus]|uniref:Glycosyltransferase 61 catalytic domain-containing protein n=1 Tax=Brassica napus TaxID=3708 RepID=A0ABQ8D5P2_BRANA|nr:xylan glycosyltransferase MUCI21 [Brassica napus]KAH0924687.1 hypothetical protein HID58_016943 [Brassica napus]
MVQYHRLIIHHGRKEERFRVSVEEVGSLKKAKQKFLSFLFLTILSCCFIVSPYLFGFSTLSLLDSFSRENEALSSYEPAPAPVCLEVSNGTICCDRTGLRSDICVMKGDIRTDSASSSLFLLTSTNNTTTPQKIKPYTRKWETSVMDTVQELNLIPKHSNKSSDRVCDVYHDVPAVFFSTGGYTGNVYHEFNDGIIPLFITSQHYNKKVVFVIVEYHDWWEMKYGDIVSQLTDYPLVDFNGDSRTHCFKEATVGLRIHDELTVNSTLMSHGNKTIVDFRNVLDRAYTHRIQSLVQEETKTTVLDVKKPKLVILSRNGSRAILNEDLLVKLAEETGFNVEVLRPNKRTEMAKIYRSMNTSDVMIGVHGAAMTHFLFLKPKSVFIQIVPLGTDWAAETYYGEPAKKLGLKYIGYKIMPQESSLYYEYGKDDPVIRDPDSLNDKGWEYTKKIYLQGQNVKLDLRRFRETLARSYDFSIRLRVREEVPHLFVS